MNTSLSKFCKDHALPKSSVYRRCQELGFETSDGLTPEAYDRLLYEFDAVTPRSEMELVEPEKPIITVRLSNPAKQRCRGTFSACRAWLKATKQPYMLL